MKRFIQVSTIAILFTLAANAAEITLLNGVILSGEVVSASAEGLTFTASGRERLYPWYSLAPGTRFRYDPASQPDPASPSIPATDTASPDFSTPLIPFTGPLDLTGARAWSGVSLGELRFFAMRTGTARDALAIFAFPVENADYLFYLAPDATRAIRVPAEIIEDDLTVFPAQHFTSAMSTSSLNAEIRWVRDQETCRVQAKVEHHDIAYRLEGQPTLFPADAIPVIPLVQPPTLDFILSAQDGVDLLNGRLRMGLFTLYPEEELNSAVTVELHNATGRSLLHQEIVHNLEAGDFTLSVPFNRPTPGEPFTLHAFANLGNPWGVIEYRKTLGN